MSERSPWTERQAAAGAALATFKGAEVPARVSDPAAERVAATAGAAVMELAWQSHFIARGRHRARFVHNMTTCQVKALEAGQGNFGMVVNDKGQLVAQLHLDAEADALLIETGEEDRERVMAQLRRYRVADDVRFEAEDRWSVVALVGPEADRVAAAAGVPLDGLDAEHAWRDVELWAATVRVRRTSRRIGEPGLDLRVAAEDAPALIDRLVGAGAVAIGLQTWTWLRVRAGWPADGVDMGAANLPLEAQALYDTVDWDKGCYIGQEVIAMTHYRGRPSRHLRAVRRADGGPLPTGAEIVAPATGKPVGAVGSVATLEGLGEVALAVLKRKHAEPGTRLQLAHGAGLIVAALPLEA